MPTEEPIVVGICSVKFIVPDKPAAPDVGIDAGKVAIGLFKLGLSL